MKSKKKQKPDYAALEWKIYIKITLITVAAVVVVILLRSLASNKAGNFIVSALQRVYKISYSSASIIYQSVIRSHMDYILYTAIAVFFIVLARFLLSQFAKYFDEISNGLDSLVEDKSGEIKLSSEMISMESKLIAIKQVLEKREQDAKQAEQRKNDVAMYLAHDIKTPLTSIIGYLSLLDEAPDMPAEQKAKYVHITFEKATQLERLVEEFFEITRYNFQTLVLSKEDIDLSYMLTQMADEFYPLLTVKGKRIVLHIPEDLTVRGDPDKLARVFNNILKNAAAYSPDGSEIEITAAQSANAVSILFKNMGNIPKDKLTSIFEKFYRLDSDRSSDSGGAGLGLAIAKEIVIQHGGKIFADNDGGYTMFAVELPTEH